VLPIIIFAAVLVPLLVIAFIVRSRSMTKGEHPHPEDASERRRMEQEFAESEEYQAKWRAEQHEHQSDTFP
jgi:hypothetical protein